MGTARNRRARTGREAVEVVGVVSLGTLPAGTTEAQVDDKKMVLEVRMSRPHPQTGLDRMMVLEVGDESAPPPTPPPSQPERHLNFNPSYIISALCASL